jgi:magnesium transporter
MGRLFHRVSKKSGRAPGSVVYIGEPRTEPATIEIIDYDEQNLREKQVASVEECFAFRDSPTVTWINVNGLQDVGLIEKLGRHFELHPLVLEDIANTGQRPKLEDSEKYTFVVVKMLYDGSPDERLQAEQVSIVFGDNFVITFQERKGDVFTSVRDRLRKTVPRVRFMGADYLAYALIDAIVDNYFVVLEQVGERLENLEDQLVTEPATQTLSVIHDLKRELIFMRRAVWPLREVIGGFDRLDSAHMHDFTRPYIRDLYEHTIQVIDTVETYRDMTSGLLDIYLSSVSNRMNEVMKMLTIIATIFIPLGFLAGVYGMNFDSSISPFNMPELHLKLGYPLFWAAALAIAGLLLWFFRRKKWI